MQNSFRSSSADLTNVLLPLSFLILGALLFWGKLFDMTQLMLFFSIPEIYWNLLQKPVYLKKKNKNCSLEKSLYLNSVL